MFLLLTHVRSWVCKERHLTPQNSDVRIIGLNESRNTNLNFHRAYIDTNWSMHTVSFVGNGILLITDIPLHWMMEN